MITKSLTNSKISKSPDPQELYSWYCPNKGQLLIIHHPCAAATIVNVDSEYKKLEEKLVMTPFAIGSTKVRLENRDHSVSEAIENGIFGEGSHISTNQRRENTVSSLLIG